jgi:hypothetical protein
VQLVHDFDSRAVLHLDHALLLEPLRGLADHAATDSELLGEGALGRQPAFFGRGLAADEGSELVTDDFHEGSGTQETGDVHSGERVG